jgi:hypothetical protein
MPVPGYDPEDLDDALENKLTRQQKRDYLSEEEWAIYRSGDASLIDLLDDGEIEGLLADADGTTDAPSDE